MESPHSLGDVTRELLKELSRLNRQQSEALEKASYAMMSKSDKEAYDRRRAHIVKVCELLGKGSAKIPLNL